MVELIVVRHGETDWNRVRRLQGHTDIALNDRGLKQAARLAAALASEPIATIHSSDLGRALSTALPLAAALDLEVETHASLRERNYGVLEGLTFDEILERHPDHADRLRSRDAAWRFANGESQEEFYERVIGAVSDIARASSATTLVVTHGGVLDMLHRAVFDLPLDAERTCLVPNGAINRLAFDGDRFIIREWATML